MSYLDRSNIGNAKTGGLQTDFNLNSNQYSVVLLAFFVSRTGLNHRCSLCLIHLSDIIRDL